ncbi:hypothetical protein DY000_02042832 [Brassica cretica]|uniref:Vps4 oligomerisation C-terminal domain-containing protein n=1 Tax=Brassica cretica TaxID=69181 RepID=A0ABQ7BFZ1_BRACR|nr:hypothetical protein DY000_02042832 [Brassica cretica]
MSLCLLYLSLSSTDESRRFQNRNFVIDLSSMDESSPTHSSAIIGLSLILRFSDSPINFIGSETQIICLFPIRDVSIAWPLSTIAPRNAKKRMRVLDEDAYVEAIEKIIERDYFPDITKLKDRLDWIQAVKARPGSDPRLPIKDHREAWEEG